MLLRMRKPRDKAKAEGGVQQVEGGYRGGWYPSK